MLFLAGLAMVAVASKFSRCRNKGHFLLDAQVCLLFILLLLYIEFSHKNSIAPNQCFLIYASNTLSSQLLLLSSIPSMSVEPERVFSGAKHTISDKRASLKPDTIEALKCCKSMLRARVFTDGDISTAMSREQENIQD